MSGAPSEPDLPVDEGSPAASRRRPGPGSCALRVGPTPLGPPEHWPASLSAVVRVMLTSRFAMWMAWGPELTFLCNDAYLPTVGLKRDWVIGSRSDKVWAEIWPDIGPRIQHVLADRRGDLGRSPAAVSGAQRLRRGDLSHLLLLAARPTTTGATTGMLCVVAEVTERVIGERQLATLRDVGARLSAASTPDGGHAGAGGLPRRGARDVPFALVYLAARDGEAPRLAAMHGLAGTPFASRARLALDDPSQAVWPFSPGRGACGRSGSTFRRGRRLDLSARPLAATAPAGAVAPPIRTAKAERRSATWSRGSIRTVRSMPLIEASSNSLTAQVAAADRARRRI